MKNIISASRRTDIPAFYYDWLQEALMKKYVTIPNPMYNSLNLVDLSPDKIHSIVLWSKNFENVLNNPGYLENYNLYFQYTITNYSKFLEPNVPEYNKTLKTLDGLLKKYKPEQFNIRFDPIIISNKGEINPTPHKPGLARLQAFKQLCKDLKSLGMDNCRVTTSYLSLYGTVKKNIEKSGLDIIHLNEEYQRAFMKKMVEIAKKYDRDIYTCSNPVFDGIEGIKKGHCIDGELLSDLFGKCTKAKDRGQREACGCVRSTDIGMYVGQPCKHSCKYCYSRGTNVL